MHLGKRVGLFEALPQLFSGGGIRVEQPDTMEEYGQRCVGCPLFPKDCGGLRATLKGVSEGFPWQPYWGCSALLLLLPLRPVHWCGVLSQVGSHPLPHPTANGRAGRRGAGARCGHTRPRLCLGTRIQ